MSIPTAVPPFGSVTGCIPAATAAEAIKACEIDYERWFA